MKKKIAYMMLMVCIIGMVITGCGAKKTARPEMAQTKSGAPAEIATASNVARDVAVEESAAFAGEVGIDTDRPAKNTSQKLIYRANMYVEVTEKVRPLVASLQDFVNTHDGYIESMEQYRHGYDPVTQEELESVMLRIRIPHENYKKTLQTISELGAVVNESSSTEDVTLQYSDIESTLKMYKVEQERLLEMLQNKTVDVKDMIEIEKRLSEVRIEIEKQESAKRALESLINYDTIELQITQVRRVSQSNEPKSFVSRIGSTFIKSIDEVVIFMQEIVLLITYLLIPIAILSVVGAVVYSVIRKLRKTKKDKAPTVNDKNEQ